MANQSLHIDVSAPSISNIYTTLNIGECTFDTSTYTANAAINSYYYDVGSCNPSTLYLLVESEITQNFSLTITLTTSKLELIISNLPSNSPMSQLLF
jgi:hypothetical protein